MSDPVRLRAVSVPVYARPPLLDGEVAADEALRTIVFECLAHAEANIPSVLDAKNSEGLHQFRVGLRRLRTALKLVEAPALAALDIRAKAIVNAVGPARDLDVFLAELFHPAVEELGHRRGFDILSERAERLRQAMWKKALDEIASPAFGSFAEEVAATARRLRWPVEEGVGVLAPTLLDHALKRARKRGRKFGELDPPARHRLRIALKKLRYGAEFFAPLYPKKPLKRWLTPLKELQDMLGHLNDVAQVRGVVGRLLLEEAASASVQADLSHAAGLLQGFHQARSEIFAQKTGRRWTSFRDAEPFWV